MQWIYCIVPPVVNIFCRFVFFFELAFHSGWLLLNLTVVDRTHTALSRRLGAINTSTAVTERIVIPHYASVTFAQTTSRNRGATGPHQAAVWKGLKAKTLDQKQGCNHSHPECETRTIHPLLQFTRLSLANFHHHFLQSAFSRMDGLPDTGQTMSLVVVVGL